MEKNIQDDRLDDFVKKSFEDHEENPATDMWERIEGQIPAEQDRKPVWFAWRGYRWQLAAATVILLLVARLVCVQLYYEEKLRAINGQKEQVTQKNGPVLPKETTVKDNSPNDTPATAKAKSIQPSLHTQQTKTNSSANSSQKTSKPDISHSVNSSVKKEDSVPSGNETAVFFPVPLPDSATGQQKLAIEQSKLDGPGLPVKTNAFQALAQKNPLLSFNRTNRPAEVFVPTKKHKERSGWYVGMFISPHLIVEKSDTPKRPGSGNTRHLYANLQERPQVSTELWLRVGKKINTRFALESGLGFQQLTRTSKHRPRFEYREGNPIQPSGSAESRSFDYDLNTYGGSASVSLRTEVDGNDAPAATERVGAIITCQEQIQLLQLPVIGVARLGHSRLQAVIKAGVLGSYLTKNEIKISASTLENTKLRFRGSDGYSVLYNRPQNFIFGYQVSAGAEFRVNKNLSIAASPTLSGDLPRKDALRGKLPGHTSFGMNVGANWWF